MEKCYVYLHFTLDTDELFYVGKGTWSEKRRNVHNKRKIK
jgi:hypothetical protein